MADNTPDWAKEPVEPVEQIPDWAKSSSEKTVSKEPTAQPAMTAQQRYRQTLKAYHDQGTENPDVAPGYVSPETSKAFAEDKANIPQLGAQWGDVGIGAAKGLAGGIFGGLFGDIESLGRLPFQIPGVREYIADVSPHTVIPTSEEGGYLGPRGIGAFKAPENAREKAGATIGSMLSPNVLSGFYKGASSVAKAVAGQATFVGPLALETAYNAGYKGGESAKAFRESITKTAKLDEVVQEAKYSIANMREAKNADYAANMEKLSKDPKILNFDEIDKSIAAATQIDTYHGKVLRPLSDEVRKKMNDVIREWRAEDPAIFHTPVGFDALKRKLGGILEKTERGTSENVAALEIYNAVRKTIVDQAPAYASIMKAYEKASDITRELESTFSIKNSFKRGAAQDTSLRKLQTILRDNVNASYGNREQLAQYLIANGSPNLMEKLAGQALNPYSPRGLGKLSLNIFGQIAAIAAGSMGGVPLATFLGGVAVSSPRLMGNIAYLSGVGARYGNKVPAGTAARLGSAAGVGDGTFPVETRRTIPQITIHKEPSRATGGSVFDKMHMARKRAEGGGTDVPFNEWDAVPRNAEGIPQIRIEKPPVNEADEAQAAREAAAARIAGNVRGAPYEPTPPSTEGKTWMMEPGKEAVQSGNYEMPPNVRLNDAGIPYNVETGEELQMARRPNVLPLTRTPDGVEWAMPKAVELAGDIVNPLAVTKGVALNPGEFALGSGPIKRAVLEQPNAPTFYSALDRAVADIPQAKASAEQWAATLANRPGVKPEEIQWRGLDQYLAGRAGQTVTKQEIADHLAGNKVELGTVQKGNYDRAGPLSDGDVQAFHDLSNETWAGTTARERAQLRQEAQQHAFAGETKYSGYQLPGGENYREMLLTMPEKDTLTRHNVKVPEGWGDTAGGNVGVEVRGDNRRDFRSSHWDEPNPVTHMRTNERTIGNTASHHIEEVQSDWHQKGRERGYQGPDRQGKMDRVDAEHKALIKEFDDGAHGTPRGREIINRLEELMVERRQLHAQRHSVPDAPFKKTWPDLTMKQALRDAVEGGKDRLSWTPGEAQAKRYNLSQHVKEIEYVKNSDGTYRVGIADKDGEPIRSLPGIDVNRMTMAQIEATVGKEIAVKIENGSGRRYRGHDGHTLEGLDLKVGGEGMNEFYNKMLPKAVEKLGKAYGVKVQRGVDTTGNPVNYVDIPPAWKQEILKKGFPLFSSGGSVFDKMHAAKHMAEGGGLESFIKSLGSQGAAFGTQTEQEQAGHQRDPISELGKGAYNAVEHLAKENIDNANLLATGNRDQFSGKPGFEAAMLPMGTGAVAGVPMRAGEAVLGAGPIRAYHGSPHEFDKFDLAKIGTGEGAQAYGHGLYFAENEGIARNYRDALASRGAVIGGKPINTFLQPDIANKVWDTEARAAGISDEVRKAVSEKLDSGLGGRAILNDLTVDFYGEKLDDVARILQGSKGHMYEVNINAHPDHFLDWDKPLSGQLPDVQAKIGKVARFTQHERDNLPIRVALEMMGSPKDYSAKMHAAGIPGIKYLDQGSRQFSADAFAGVQRAEAKIERLRASGETGYKLDDALQELQSAKRSVGDLSSNYVVFDPKIIEIMKKYGMTLPAATAAYEAMKTDQEKTGFKKGGSVFDKMKRASK